MTDSRRPRRWLFLLGLFSVLALGEVVTRISYAMEGKVPRHADTSVYREWHWAADHLASGIPSFEGLHAYDSRFGWANRPNQEENGVRTNGVGMRSSREFSIERAPDTPRMVLVGDSYTFGFNVSDEEAFHAVLQREQVPDWEVLNLAVSGYGPDQILLSYEEVGAQYRPDVVVFGFYVRGFFRLFTKFRGYAKPYFELEGDGSLRIQNAPVIEPGELYEQYRSGQRRIAGIGYSYLLGSMFNRLNQAWERRGVDREDSSWLLMAAVLERFCERARENGAVPFLLIIPARSASRSDWQASVYADLDELAQEEAGLLGMAHLSLSEAFLEELERHPEDPVFQPRANGGHLSVHGNRMIAEHLGQALRALPGVASTPRRP